MNTLLVAPPAAMPGRRLPDRLADFQFGVEEVEDIVAAIIASAEFDLPGEPEESDYDDEDEDDDPSPSPLEQHRPR
ncbi:MAG: hypothetical protein ABWY12_19090 [Burkholderiales bacterium]